MVDAQFFDYLLRFMKLQLTALFAFILCSHAFGNPSGGSVVSGEASFETNGSTLTIRQATDQAVIRWNGGFSIADGELTQFIQNSSTSAVLNQDVSGIPSSILGNLLANGRVYLMNRNGVIVGASGRIETAGFLATTLDQWTSDFFENGELGLSGDSDAAIVNLGNITATGDIFLIAREIDNQGTIQSSNGFVGLAAGKNILLKESGEERIFVQPYDDGDDGGKIDITGSIEALDIEIRSRGNSYATAINLEGQLTANKVGEVGGRVFLWSDEGGIQVGFNGIEAEGVVITAVGGSIVDSSLVANGGSLVAADDDIVLMPGGTAIANNNNGGGISVSSGNAIYSVSLTITGSITSGSAATPVVEIGQPEQLARLVRNIEETPFINIKKGDSFSSLSRASLLDSKGFDSPVVSFSEQSRKDSGSVINLNR